ncbi:MAG: SDR family oxidoreductase, partial [Alphaproteobacteria bacterium]|nr:SDR family oxidoreductase [Alphaproteobacteria bacterium]
PRPTGTANLDVYDASKWALNGLTFAWAKAMAPHGVRVNGICMGATDSHMIRGFFGYAPDQEEWDEDAKKEIDTWMSDKDAAQVIVDLLKEGPKGRTAKTMNFCVGRPCKLEPPHPDVYVLEEHLHVAT